MTAPRAFSRDHGAPLESALDDPRLRVTLYCGACAWTRSYSTARVIARLRETRRGDGQTAIGAVARWVQWPCPACRRMRWATRFSEPGEAPGRGWG